MKAGGRNLKEFFSPKCVAVIGASSNVEKVGGILMKKNLNFSGKIVPINPNYSEIFGRKCYKTILEVPDLVDLVVIAVPKEFVKEVFNQCAKKGIKNVILVSAGFAEAGDLKAQDELMKVASKNNINLLGPNCFGLFNSNLNLDLTFSAKTPQKSDTVFISQSGALWSYLADLEIGFYGFVSLGNMADLSFEDFIKLFENDKEIKNILLYVEKLKDGKAFIEACKKSSKKIIVVKAGKSFEGVRATISHTASLASDFEIYKAAFEKAGIKMADSVVSALKKFNLPNFNKVFILTNAGGAGALLTDYLKEKGIELASISGFKNPWDILGTAKAENYQDSFKKIAKDSSCVVALITPQSMADIEKIAEVIVEYSKLRPVIACMLGKGSFRKAEEIFKKEKVAYSFDLKEVADILAIK